MKSKYIIRLIIVFFVLFYLSITFFPEQMTYILSYEYRNIVKKIKRAEKLYDIGNKEESFSLYKEALGTCKNRYWNLRNHIFYNMSKSYKDEEYYFEFLKEILQNQIIEGKGRNYNYCYSNPFKLALSMLDANTTKTKEIFSTIPEKKIEEFPGLDTAWYYVLKKGAFAPK